MPVFLTLVLSFPVLALVSILFMRAVLTAELCPSLRSAVKKFSRRLMLTLLILTWCTCFLGLKSMIFPSWLPVLLCMEIFLDCLLIPSMQLTLFILLRMRLVGCLSMKNRSSTMTIVFGLLLFCLLVSLLPLLLVSLFPLSL